MSVHDHTLPQAERGENIRKRFSMPLQWRGRAASGAATCSAGLCVTSLGFTRQSVNGAVSKSSAAAGWLSPDVVRVGLRADACLTDNCFWNESGAKGAYRMPSFDTPIRSLVELEALANLVH